MATRRISLLNGPRTTTSTASAGPRLSRETKVFRATTSESRAFRGALESA